MSEERRIGVYLCYCGGNISDYVDVERVLQEVRDEPGVTIARTAMFTCSDATQREIVSDIREQSLDGMVVASCSPILHTATFREVARRAGLNPYAYTQVNIREQCSWTHTDDHEGATEKAIRLVRAGIAHVRLSEPLEPVVVETVPRTLVVGGGITGLRAALGLAEIGIEVFLVEREEELGGWVACLGSTYPHASGGGELIDRLVEAVRAMPSITVFTGAELVEKSGSFGNYQVSIRIGGDGGEKIGLEVGSIVVATGFDSYQPEAGEHGYGIDGVVTLPELEELLTSGGEGELVFDGKPVETVAYVYCVGSRQPGGHEYCSRFCCTAAVNDALRIAERSPGVRQYHLYRDMRAYGRNELLYSESRERGSLYIRFPEAEPPQVEKLEDGRLRVTVRDLLTEGEELRIEPDLLVLVTGMVPRSNEELTGVLKLPLDKDGFFNEIHPKLRPVETVVDGVLIAGACQGPKSVSESTASALAAATQSAAMLKRGTAELDPLVATVDPERCTWCGECADTCPFDAVSEVALDGKKVAVIEAAGCKGCGGCVPICPEDAIDLHGYTDAQMRAMIDGLLEGAAR
jgi:heterodisulfide reductase subunit A